MRTHRSKAWFGVAAVASLLACATAGVQKGDRASNGTVTITQEQIARTSATSAWEVLKNEVRRYTYKEDRSGRPLRIVAQRGVSSIILSDSDAPMVIIDGARLTDIAALAQLPASGISSIEILSGIRGSGSQGTNASAGVIYIHTRDASSP
ncbi:MAG TPA: TonB-dependent receptor plug domain-containing protein [Gemmatimonadaceae bacterium]|nr:TonB-dependent receptor plug domain-containing protein [Gemmatimonadaceae bacterium]